MNITKTEESALIEHRERPLLDLLQITHPQITQLNFFPHPPDQIGSRTLLDGSEVAEYAKAIEIHLTTHCPEKWLHIDTETGQVWQWKTDHFELIYEDLHTSETAIEKRL